MTPKWEYTCCYGNIREGGKGSQPSFSDPSLLWESKDKDGKSTWNTIESYGKDGWELVSVTPINNNFETYSFTKYVLYTFKRPLEEN